MNSANCTRNSQIRRNIENGYYINNKRFRDYGSLECDRPSWDFRIKRHGQILAKIEREKNK